MLQQLKAKTINIAAMKKVGSPSFYVDVAAQLSSCPTLSVFNCDKYSIFPGFCDVHVHFREPGFSYKETIETGCKASARGGYTAVCTMPNLNPVPDTAEHLEEQTDIIKKEAICLPSTSPANAAWTLDRLIDAWKVIITF